MSRGGGVDFVYVMILPLSNLQLPHFSFSDCLSLILKIPSLTLHITVIYCAPKHETILFYIEFYDFIYNFPSSSPYLPIFIGDLNYYFNTPIYPHGDIKLTESLSLCQHISFPTHSSGNTLDMICTPYPVLFLDV